MDERKSRGRRAQDGGNGWHALVRENWYRDVWLFMVTALVFWALYTFEHEGSIRRDQACLLFERADHAAKEQLARTYDYLDGLTPDDYRESLNKAILVQLPATEGSARAATAPDYCTPTDVGSHLPRAQMPVRPRDIPQTPP